MIIFSAWRARKSFSALASVSSLFAKMATANNAALAAPASPMAKVATGIPRGICTMAYKESMPFRAVAAIGTPKTGNGVFAAITPGKCVAADDIEQISGRAMLVKRLEPLPIEAVCRGYLIGSGWKDYQQTGAVCGIALPSGLQLAEKLPEVIFTPATKAQQGEHDENISFAQMADIIGKAEAEKVRDASFEIYQQAAKYAETKGIIIADTKFEFAFDDDGSLVLIDEVLTPDSSRFWPADSWRAGENPQSFDKQPLRNWLEETSWDKKTATADHAGGSHQRHCQALSRHPRAFAGER